MTRPLRLAVALAAAVLLCGCAAQAWYAGLQNGSRQHCQRLQDRDERERCLRRTQVPYESYERSRQRLADEPPAR